MKKNKILLIGGTGLVGGYLAKLLSLEKNTQIEVISRSPLTKKNKVIGVHYHQVDLNNDFDQKSILPIMPDLDMVVVMTPPSLGLVENLLKILDLAPQLNKIIHLSTLLVYPSSSRPSKETIKPRPLTLYEKNKLQEEKLLTAYAKKRKIKLSTIRLANVYGDVLNRGIIGLAFNALKQQAPLFVNGTGEQVRDYIFVEEAAKLIKFIIFHWQRQPKEVFNVSTGEGHTIKEILDLIQKITKNDLLIQHRAAVAEKKSVIGNNAKIIKLSGQKLTFDLPRGLKKTYSNYFF